MWIIITLAGFPETPDCARRLQQFLPESRVDPDWNLSGEPECYEGEDLFLMINGGAEIYHEYGFKRVVAAVFVHSDGRTRINVEIYEMNDPTAAFGMYTQKSSLEGESLSENLWGRLEDYYLNFWKGRFVVTITGFNAERKTVDGLKVLARAIGSGITSTGSGPPALFDLFKEWTAGWRPRDFAYMKGHLSLYNRLPLSSGDIFKFREGMFGKFDDCRLLLLAYANGVESAERYKDILRILGGGDTIFLDGAYPGFETVDHRGDKLLIALKAHYILILNGKRDGALRSRLSTLLERIPPDER